MKNTLTYFLLLTSLLLINRTIAQTPTPLLIELETFISGVDDPVGIENAGDDRLFILERHSGIIKIYDLEGNYINDFLELDDISTGSEQGLLGLAFHPNYQDNGRFFVNYTDSSGDTKVSEFQVTADPDVADENSEQVILDINQPEPNHNGGGIAFDPDGYLMIGMGDGGGAGDQDNNAQTTTELLGKMLRIDVDSGDPYSIPDDNPFVDESNTLDEIWAIGMRNPWRFSFDSETGDLWIADVGQNIWEEINLEPASSSGGLNYGWRCYEATHPYNLNDCDGDYVDPIAEYNHSSGFCSITGGLVYRGAQYPRLEGQYLFTDYCLGYIYGLKEVEGEEFEETLLNDEGHLGYVAFGVDVNQQPYLADLSDNQILRIVDPCGTFDPQITINSEEEIIEASEGVEVYWYFNDVYDDSATGDTFSPDEEGEVYAVIENEDGCALQSNTVNWIPSSIENLSHSEINLYPNPAEDILHISGIPRNSEILIFNSRGQNIEAKININKNGDAEADITGMKAGIYVVHVKSGEKISSYTFSKK